MPEFHDKKGVPILPGDLIRTFHFRARNRRRKHYLYHTAVFQDGVMWLVPTCHLEKTTDRGGKCVMSQELLDGGDSEVIADCFQGNLCFYERARMKVEG